MQQKCVITVSHSSVSSVAMNIFRWLWNFPWIQSFLSSPPSLELFDHQCPLTHSISWEMATRQAKIMSASMTLFYSNPPQNVVLLCCHGSDCLRHVMKGVKKTDWKEWRRRWIHELSLISVQTTVLSRIPFLKEELGASSFHSFEVTCLERCIPCVRWKEGIWAWKSETLKDMEAEEWAVSCKSWQSRGVPGSFKKFWKTFFDWLQSLFYISSCIL